MLPEAERAWLKFQQLNLDIEGKGAFAAGAIEPSDFVFDGPSLTEALPDAVALFIKPCVPGIVAPETRDVEGFVESLPILEIVFVILVAQIVGGEAERPPFLINQLDRCI